VHEQQSLPPVNRRKWKIPPRPCTSALFTTTALHSGDQRRDVCGWPHAGQWRARSVFCLDLRAQRAVPLRHWRPCRGRPPTWPTLSGRNSRRFDLQNEQRRLRQTRSVSSSHDVTLTGPNYPPESIVPGQTGAEAGIRTPNLPLQGASSTMTISATSDFTVYSDRLVGHSGTVERKFVSQAVSRRRKSWSAPPGTDPTRRDQPAPSIVVFLVFTPHTGCHG
jgi:hypothetical protein